MKIALMGRSLRPPLTGIGRHTLNLARGLATAHGCEMRLYVTKETPIPALGERCRVVRAPLPTPHEVLRGIWEQTLVARDVRGWQADVYHSPNYSIPLSLPCPSVLTVHDLSYLDPRFHNLRLRLYLRFATDFSMKRASRVICVSEFTRGQVLERYPGVAGRADVVYNGLDELFACRPPERVVDDFREAHGLKQPYVLHVGSIEPRKNIPRLVAAFETVIRRTGLDHELVIAGPWGWRYQASKQAIHTSPYRERIRVVGYLPAQELPLLYAGAAALVYPSLEEGFGYPPLEAMAMGCPVVTSDSSSLPEVAGDAALTVSPTDVEALSNVIESVLTDSALADRLVVAGSQRASMFTQERATEGTLDVYRRAVRSGAAA